MKTHLVTLGLGLLAMSTNLHAAPAVYEGFNYPPAAFMSTTSGPMTTGTGLTGSWSATSDSGVSASTIASGSLAYSNLQTSGNQLNYSATSGTSTCSYKASIDTDANTSLSATSDGVSKDIWMSYLMRIPSWTSAPLFDAHVGVYNPSGSAAVLQVKFDRLTATSGNFIITGNGAGGGVVFSATNNTTVADGQTVMVVIKQNISYSANGTTYGAGSLWILNSDAPLPANEAGLGVANASYAGGANAPTTSIRQFGILDIRNGSSVTGYQFDEIRIGTTFADVVVVTP